MFTELGAHVRFPAGLMALCAVFLPQQGQGHTRPSQFAVDVRIIWFGVLAGCFVLVRKEKLFQIGVGDIGVQGPGHALLLCCLQYIPYRMPGTVCH